MRSLRFGLLAIFIAPCTIGAHHSPAALFDLADRTSIAGTVVEFRFANPHAVIILDCPQPDGSVERWHAEGGTPSALVRNGWTGQELRAGDQVTIVGNPSRDGSQTINWQVVSISDGRQLGGGNGIPSLAPALEPRWQKYIASVSGN